MMSVRACPLADGSSGSIQAESTRTRTHTAPVKDRDRCLLDPRASHRGTQRIRTAGWPSPLFPAKGYRRNRTGVLCQTRPMLDGITFCPSAVSTAPGRGARCALAAFLDHTHPSPGKGADCSYHLTAATQTVDAAKPTCVVRNPTAPSPGRNRSTKERPSLSRR